MVDIFPRARELGECVQQFCATMTTVVRGGAPTFLLVLVLASVSYSILALLLVTFFRHRGEQACGYTPPVTILKPLCGLEPALFDCLRSFCEQDYPSYQIVFGVRDAADPAVPVVERLMRELPHVDATLVVDGRMCGSNYKLSNLANMLGAARHDILVVADSDGRVEPNYLRSVASLFANRRVGAVTCLYVAEPLGGAASVLGASFINDWFLPSVLIALALGRLNYCFGATMAVRRDVLEAIGGFATLAPYLADDYLLGRLVSDRGFEVRLATSVVTTVVSEPDFGALFRHELRWGRTLRTVRPLGWASTLLTDTTVLALLFLLASGGSALGSFLLGTVIILRVGVHAAVRRRFGIGGPDRPLLVPVRDLLSFGVRIVSFFGRTVEWRGKKFVLLSSGRIEERANVPRGRS